MGLLRTILACGFEKNFTKIKLKQNEVSEDFDFMKFANQIIFHQFLSYFPVAISEQEFLEAYEQTFKKFRDQSSLFIYARQIQKDFNPLLSKALTTFVEKVLKNEFKTWRYDIKNSVHLKEVFKGREGSYLLWQKNAEYSFEDLAMQDGQDGQEKQVMINMFELIKESLAHGHLTKGCMPNLDNYFVEPDFEKRKNLELQSRQILQRDKTVKHQFELSIIELSQTVDLKQMEKSLIALLAELNRQKELSELIGVQFISDLKGWLATIKSHSADYRATILKAIDTDHPWDLFRCGTDVSGSCQSIYSKIEYNKCLLGYVLKGNIRLLALVSDTGVIKARAILRLLLLEDGTPALFLEKFYPSITKPQEQKALVALATKRAIEMNWPLYSSNDEEKNLQEKVQLLSKDGQFPFEYVDAGHRGVTNGCFTIYPTKLHYSPVFNE